MSLEIPILEELVKNLTLWDSLNLLLIDFNPLSKSFLENLIKEKINKLSLLNLEDLKAQFSHPKIHEFIKNHRKEPDFNEFVLRFKDKNLAWAELTARVDLNTILMLPEKNWNFRLISLSKNLDLKILKKWEFLPWDWQEMSKNPSLTLDIVEYFIDKNWLFYYIKAPPEFMIKYSDKNWDWRRVDLTQIPTDFILSHLDLDWNLSKMLEIIPFDLLSSNKIIAINYCTDINFIIENLESFNWNLGHLSKCSNITLNYLDYILERKKVSTLSFFWKVIFNKVKPTVDFVIKWCELNLPWDIIFDLIDSEELIEKGKDNKKIVYNWLNFSKNITLERINSFKLPLNKMMRKLSENPNANLDLNLPWDFHYLSIYHNDPDGLVFKFWDQNLSWVDLSERVKLETIVSFKDKPWSIQKIIYSNNNFNLSFLDKLPDFDWPFLNINCDDLDFVLRYKDKLDLNTIISGSEWIPPNILNELYDSFNWYYISRKNYFTDEYVLSLNPTILTAERLIHGFNFGNLSINLILKLNHLNWNWQSIILNKKVNLDIILKNPQINWNLPLFADNENFTSRVLYLFPNVSWDWPKLSGNNFIDGQVVLDFIDKAWDFSVLSKNDRVWPYLIFEYPDLDWEFANMGIWNSMTKLKN